MSDASNSTTVEVADLAVSITPAGRTQIAQMLEQVFGCEEPKRMIELALASAAEIGQLPESPDKTAILIALEGAGYFGAGLNATVLADFGTAATNMGIAAERFHAVGAEPAHSISYAFFCFNDGTRNALLLNLDRARERWAECENYLKQKGGLQDRYRALLDQFKSDQLFLAGMRLLIAQDFDGGRSAMEGAARAARDFAKNYLAEGSENYHYYQGLSQSYIAHYNLYQSTRDFFACGYDRIISNAEGLIAPAKAAEADLAHVSKPNEIQRRVIVMVGGIRRLQQILTDFAKVMQTVMRANFNREAPELSTLQVQLAETRSIFGGLGEGGVPIVRQCEQLSRQIENVQRLSRPTVKDFGVYSGFVSAIAFVPLLLVTGWVFNHFGWGVPPVTFIWVNVGVAALVGFGAGALALLPAFMRDK